MRHHSSTEFKYRYSNMFLSRHYITWQNSITSILGYQLNILISYLFDTTCILQFFISYVYSNKNKPVLHSSHLARDKHWSVDSGYSWITGGGVREGKISLSKTPWIIQPSRSLTGESLHKRPLTMHSLS